MARSAQPRPPAAARRAKSVSGARKSPAVKLEEAVQLALLDRDQREVKHDLANLTQSMSALSKLVTDKFDGFRDSMESLRRDLVAQKNDTERQLAELEKRVMPRDALVKLLAQAGLILTLVSVAVNLGMRMSFK